MVKVTERALVELRALIQEAAQGANAIRIMVQGYG